MKVIIETIPHNRQRYPTVGDWIWDADQLTIRVSEMGDWRYEMLVAFHELAEVLICHHKGITQEEVDKFDMNYEKRRRKGDFAEPGDSPAAPYYHEHQFASAMERMLAVELGVDWNTYNTIVENL